MEMLKWPVTVKGFENLTIKDQPIADPIHKDDPQTLYLLNIGTVKYARTQFALSAAKNLYAVPLDILIRIGKVVTFYNILFADAKTPLSQRAISWLADIGRILISPLSWAVVIIAGLYAAAHPSACARNGVVKLENAFLENSKLDYLKPMTRAEVDTWARAHQIANPAPRNEEASSTNSSEPTPEPTAPTPEPSIPLTAEEQQILDDISPQMVKALGGEEKVLSIPKLEKWDGTINHEYLTAPVMRAASSHGVALLFCFFHWLEDGRLVTEVEPLLRNGKEWMGAFAFPSKELHIGSPNPILDGSPMEKYMLEKISRLMQSKAVGELAKFPNVSPILNVPKDKVASLPKDAYLKGNDLLAYMDLQTMFYERATEAGTTDIFLYDNSKTRKENRHRMREHFPAMFKE